MAISNSYNYRQISANLHTAGVVGAKRLLGLAPEGFQAVINLLPNDSEYAVEDEQVIVSQQGVDYRYIPVDFAKPSNADYQAFCEALAEYGERKILLHCAANYRVSGFYAMYAVANKRWSAEQAKQHISEIWNPADYPAWRQLLSGHGIHF